MGCDIHLHIEIKVDGDWHHYGHPWIGRSYALFAKMAGVRAYPDCSFPQMYPDCPFPPLSLPRGIPTDITKVTAMSLSFWSDCSHSYSWLGKDEITSLMHWIDVTGLYPISPERSGWGYFFENGWDSFDHAKERFPGLTDLRFVFWFDN